MKGPFNTEGLRRVNGTTNESEVISVGDAVHSLSLNTVGSVVGFFEGVVSMVKGPVSRSVACSDAFSADASFPFDGSGPDGIGPKKLHT